jgi:mono/diheme cytochrome c family protein
MTLRRPGRWIFTIAAVLVIVGIAAAAFAMRNLLSGKHGGPMQVANASPDLVARGKYLAEAADCAACHTAPGGAPFAGGLPMQTGFGTIYATNITPEPDDGIGRWSAEDSGARCTTASGATGSSSIPPCPTHRIAA